MTVRIELTRSNVLTWTFAAVGAAWLAVAPAQPTESPSEKATSAESQATAPGDGESRSKAVPPADAEAKLKATQPPSDAELKSFAGAVVEVHRINDAYVPKLQSADTPDEEQKLEAAALREMVAAVENEGLSVEKYEQILTQAQTDRDIVHRLKRPLRDALSRVWT